MRCVGIMDVVNDLPICEGPVTCLECLADAFSGVLVKEIGGGLSRTHLTALDNRGIRHRVAGYLNTYQSGACRTLMFSCGALEYSYLDADMGMVITCVGCMVVEGG